MTGTVITVFIGIVLGVPTWLGLQQSRSLTDGLKRPDRCGITPPGRLIVNGVVMDPDRLKRAVE